MLLLFAVFGYWRQFYLGKEGPWPAIVATLASIILIVFTEYKMYLLIFSLRMLGALALMGLLRAIVTGEYVLAGLVIFGIIVCAMILVGAHRPNTDWLFEEDGLGENTGSLDLNLRSIGSGDEKNQTDSEEGGLTGKKSI